MATWGTHTLEDDTATDWIDELIEAEDEREMLLEAFTIEAGDVNYDVGVIVIAACEVVVGLLDEPRRGMPENLRDWFADNECDDIADIPEKAAAALSVVLADDSELITVWQEAEDYGEWRQNVEELQETIEQLKDA